MNNWTPYLDFNDAGGQQEFSSVAEQHHEKEEIKARLQSQIESVLYHLLPAGKVRHGQFFIGDVEGNPGESMKVELTGEKAGVWYDHAAGSGGDILDLWARSRGMDTRTQFRDVMDDVRGWLGESVRLPPVSMQPTQRREPPMDELGPHTGKWDYFDTNGQLLVCVYRYDPPGRRKEFRPLDVRTGKWQSPAVTPLYNLPGIMQAAEVVLVEGEKSAQALIDAGIPATTSLGSKGQINRADWSILQGKRVIIWPDRDKAGWEYAQLASQAARNAGVREVSILTPPEGKSEKWDAADAVAEGMDVRAFIHHALRQEPKGRKRRIRLMDWTLDRYEGPPPHREWLIEGVLPLGVPGMFAAIGGAGKSMLLMDLAAKVALSESGNPIPLEALGGPIVPATGTAVMLTAEDDHAEVHRRLFEVLPGRPNPKRLIIVPMPNAGGTLPLISMSREGPILSEEFHDIREELLEIPNLRLVVIDPLQNFAGGDVNSDPAAGALFFSGLGRIAAETGATVLATHHFKKNSGKTIGTAAEAREAIRGTTALVDSGRWSYALWEVEDSEAKKVCKLIGQRFQRESVYRGAVVKSNWPTDKTVRIYARNPNSGLLSDRTMDLERLGSKQPELMDLLVTAVGNAASGGQPYTKTGGNGLYERRSELPDDLRSVGRDRLVHMTDLLLQLGKIVLCVAGDSKLKKYLDVPDGEFAVGVGQFQVGAGSQSHSIQGGE
ncbi:plasmid and phage replicative helicase / plasmid and phage DNA primase [Magnetococcus marinus MC-1]|uniref:Plasmid and phage replicative helicase / plasmid and phage DNA primase n=1 Tax=Magnetococcus marinus (strain ATCC BAA-1437 / JCM 17883 / MC-1) TaxID=156889 RepID=A0LBB6_MAGMM|nr:AAA family ATPase [Magnetococcus marinus]ABK45259.1 plasmid and phage replicative helicase / plasmid and phage DNA primase [Magnetococcus marinus MC-1]